MTSIANNYISSLSNPTNGIKTAGSDKLDQSSFLTLMTAQLKMQDPFEPMDNTQMVAQMATFSQATGISEMNQSLGKIAGMLDSMAGSLSTSRIPDAANWIGKSMLVSSDIATPDRYGVYGGEVKLNEAASDLSIDLVDASGNVVKTIDFGQKAAGSTIPFFWDGTDDAGNMIDSQALQVVVNGTNPSSISTWAAIAGVQSPADASSARLITAIGEFSPSDAKKLS
ncbi:flagellar hook assembly protein FlgD [Rhizorhapis suberifaciens]|uniref:Basal-body rod modification protein FlgD n=1 Tax=Rhizorhapis suberifaciens TaxID=13656 RepID=A0A840HXS7_9SPHN|nr:flagellar hook capping FlgD N-terminal domain-containing protein [Rhizorhapis suberifaciens]MBB4642451.1 flagellar basal-body rod modification protein FlgD [Rhizorhapis suberifaciens]